MTSLAWYKQGWPWFIISIPLAAVAFGILMLVVVEEHPDDLVVDDYYKDGMAINKQIARDNNATRRGIIVSLATANDKGVKFRFNHVTDAAVAFNLYHIVDRSKDKRLVLYPESEAGTYGTSDGSLADVFHSRGIWYVEFEGSNGNWRLRGRIETPLEKLEIGDDGNAR